MPITHATIPVPPAQVGEAEWAEAHTLPTAAEVGAAEASHTHTGVYEPADATILKDADIGVTVAAQAHGHAGVYEPVDSTILRDADIGVSVQAAGSYAPASEGVTGGNAHDHNGGDGAQIAYSSLSGQPDLSSLHARAHTMASASDHTAGNWKLWYSNGSGQVVELALGALDEVLKSGGPAAAPVFGTVTGGSGLTHAQVLARGLGA